LEVNRINPLVNIPGRDTSKPVWVPPTLHEVIEWIQTRPYDEHIKAELVKTASKYPGNALRDFVNNLAHHVARIQRKRKEENGEA
jgi:hypothetical protein